MLPLPSSTVSPRVSQYKLAIELNNVGVELLELRAYRSAMRTLREAIQVMKTVVRPGIQQQQQEQLQYQQQQQLQYLNSTCLTVENETLLLHNARQRLVAVENNKDDNNNNQDQENDDDDDDDESQMDILNSLGTPLRIESIEMQSPDGRNPDTASSVLLYNFGLVHRWAGYEQDSDALREGALRLFKMAFSILSERTEIDEEETQDIAETKVFLVIVVLNSLVQIQEEQGKHAEARYWLQQLVRLGRVALEEDDDDEEEEEECQDEMPYTFAPAA